MAGITWARVALIPSSFCWILIIILATRLLIGLRRPTGIFGKYLILPLFFLLGGVHTTPFLSPPDNPQHIYNLIEAPREVVITGTLTKAPERRSDKSRFLVETEQLRLKNATLPISGKVLLAMPGSPPNEIKPGDKIIAKTRLSRPRNHGVPGAFDYASYLANQKIWVTGWLSSPYFLRKIHDLQPASPPTKIRSFPEKIRQNIGLFIDEILPASTAGIYKAILIGDRAGIPPEITENYKAAGNIHLLAISGLHIGLLALFLSVAIAWLLRHSETMLLRWSVWKTTALISIPPLAIYALIAGFHTPVLRAIIMTYIFMGAIIWNRQGSIFNNLALAALILLTINPSDLFTVSFQLSFAAVGSIALILPQISALFQINNKDTKSTDKTKQAAPNKVKAFCLASILISFAASLGTAPLLAYHFNRISLISPISTLLIEPLLCFWSLILGLFACLFIPIPIIATGLFQAGGMGIQAANSITQLLAKLPFAFVWLPTPSIAVILAYYLFLLLFFSLLLKKELLISFFKGKKVHQIAATFLAIIILGLLSFFWPDKKQNSDQSTISILDVGQGLAIVVELPNDKIFVIDGGKKQAGPTNRFNVGRDLIAPFLWDKKIDKITGIIISHPDSDHANGIPFLIDHFAPEAIWTNSAAMHAPRLKQTREIAQNHGIPVIVPAKDEEIYAEEQISLRVIGNLHRDDKTQGKEREVEKKDDDGNNKSLIIKLTIGSTTCLFPGDIEKKAEQQLIEAGEELKANILIAPHHGSKTSSSDEFIRAVSADYVVISAGARQQEPTFPSAERMQEYRNSGSTILTTAISGSIFFRIKEKMEVSTFY